MRVRHAVALVATIALAYACGSRAHALSMVTAGTASTPGTSGARGGLALVRPVAMVRASHAPAVATTLDVSVHGDEVRFVLQVTNTSDKKLELTFPNGQTHDLVVLDAAGGEVWRWGSAQMFTQALRNQPLDAHATLTYSVHWRQPTAHGALTAVGTLMSTNYPAESRQTFELP